tara:strand:+ start:133 stop:462 length:330 start_codon:yes stop_codon:yes gene_type:complete
MVAFSKPTPKQDTDRYTELDVTNLTLELVPKNKNTQINHARVNVIVNTHERDTIATWTAFGAKKLCMFNTSTLPNCLDDKLRDVIADMNKHCEEVAFIGYSVDDLKLVK